MVNRGRSKGCNTCRQRRVKCDEAKPNCRRCAAARRTCGGYERKKTPVKFKLIKTSAENYVPKRDEGKLIATSPDTPVPALEPAEDDVALCFFISNYAAIGRDFSSTRGFFEIIQPVLSAEPSGSAISLAVSMLSSCMYTRHTAWPGSPKTRLKFGRALQQLQAEIEHPTKSRSNATLLATMVLQFHDNLAAVLKLRRVGRTHHDVALALPRHRGKSIGQSPHGQWLLSHVLHTEVSSALREKRPLTEEDLHWLDYEALPLGASPALDLIGISIANLQHQFLKFDPDERESLLLEADNINNDLLEWKAGIPTHWQPYRLEHVKKCRIPILNYNDLCDVYPAVQIGSILNLWRCYRLIVLKISLTLRHYEPDTDNITDTTKAMNQCQEEIQDTVDGICASVPFFIGNRRHPGMMSDFTDPDLSYPSYHDVPLESLPANFRHKLSVSKEDHARHVVAQGMWHMMSPLSHVVSMCSERRGYLVIGCLREGQIEWLRGQLRRTSVIMRLNMIQSRGNVSPGWEREAWCADDRLVEGMRDGLRMTSGS